MLDTHFKHTIEKREQKGMLHDRAGGGYQKPAVVLSHSGPQAQLVEGATAHLQALLFRACFLLDERDVTIEEQFLPMQPLDGNLLDKCSCAPDVEKLLWRIDEEHHVLACQRLLDVVGLDQYGALSSEVYLSTAYTGPLSAATLQVIRRMWPLFMRLSTTRPACPWEIRPRCKPRMSSRLSASQAMAMSASDRPTCSPRR
jgi:hypothetical protein